MQNDTISRSALVADLESFKVQMGDPVLRFLVDRVIERVKAQPGVDAVVVPPGDCNSCRHRDVDPEAEPCLTCFNRSLISRPNWEAPHENV